jgi:signal transduction histidine kinase
MRFLEKLMGSGSPGETWTLRWVTLISFLVTGAFLLGWDLIEHVYFADASSVYLHRMHAVRGISSGVLMSVAIAWVLQRNRGRYEKRMLELQQELIRSERLAAVGELAGGVAHEIRNPLAGIGGALSILAREVPPDDDTQEMMDEIQQQIRRMERLVEDLLAYARPGQLHAEWTHLQAILEQAATSTSQVRGAPEVNLVLDFDPEVPEVYADPRELEHAFENLILNAFQAIDKDGEIRVRTSCERDWVHVAVSDDGVGMDEGVREKIFEPFFTTKARGTGLGLSFVRRAVENYGGRIEVRTAPGGGSTFDIMLATRRNGGNGPGS